MFDQLAQNAFTETRTELPGEDNNRLMEAMDFSPITQGLGRNAPALIPGELGRLRLIQSLRQNYGEGFRSNQEARGMISHFDEQTSLAKEILRLRGGGL